MKTKSSYTQRYCFSISFQCSLNSQLYNSGQIKTPLAEQGRGLDENYCRDVYMLECLLAYAESGVLDDLHADGWPRSPLAVAASLGRRPMMDEILQDQQTDDDDDLNWTVIHSICESGDVYMLKRLLAYAEPGVLDVLHAGGRPKPPLLVAASLGRLPVVDALLARGVDVNTRRDDGETALHAAARGNWPALVDRLLDAGACMDARDAVTGRRPLDVAVHTWGRDVSVTALLVHSDRMAKAVVRHDVDAVAFLLACGVSPNMTTEAYGSPLHVAVRHRRYRMMATILSSDRCRTTVRHNGATPLDYAVAAGDARAVKMITWCEDQRRRRSRHASLTAVPANRKSQQINAPRRCRTSSV